MGKESHYSSKKDRVFVRGIQGQYSLNDELKRLRSMPRVIKGKDLLFNDGPQSFSKHFIEPVDGMTQTLHVHLEEYGPGGRTQKHGHVNEAAFYILDGKGYEIHDGIRYDWSAGDVAIVHMNCVHQHFNADPVKPARALVLKPKPMVMFMNMLFQKSVIPRPTEPTPEGRGFVPRHFEENLNHLGVTPDARREAQLRAAAAVLRRHLPAAAANALYDVRGRRPDGEDRRRREEGKARSRFRTPRSPRSGPARGRRALREEARHQGDGVASGHRQGPAARHCRGARAAQATRSPTWSTSAWLARRWKPSRARRSWRPVTIARC